MADHVRQQIRNAVATRLTGLATTGANVYIKPMWVRSNGELPALEIMTGEDTVDVDMTHLTSAGAAYYRRLEVIVEAMAKVGGDVQDTLDTIAKEAEIALYADEKLGGLTKSIERVDAEQELSTEGEKKIGRLVMVFEFLYTVRGGAPDVAL